MRAIPAFVLGLATLAGGRVAIGQAPARDVPPRLLDAGTGSVSGTVVIDDLRSKA